ncbi:MAG: hypothetical protein KKE44_11925 [Proteobacteria bacterium]|nr:hypothetical protein [Pseudomonadota bacterium]MBU1583433.1 hypothetical protein [Pseudomonadota bacterium]MBU2452119.1 hypothetical protein [Pseudomonadota bacterium]MBU2631657.1 hypothetical protein [Pseudomonadota bacterium]
MVRSDVGKKRKSVEKPNSYFALRSENEIYFQMASIYKQVANDKNKLVNKIFKGFLADSNASKFFMDNSL